MEYVMGCLGKNTTSTISGYYQAEVNHNMLQLEVQKKPKRKCRKTQNNLENLVLRNLLVFAGAHNARILHYADDGTFLESIITDDGKNMPFSVYGDGIKKILYILNKLFDATDSILLIDEIETGLHKKYYDTLFPVVFALASKLNVQLFIATHSVEAIEAILKYGECENDANSNDPIKVITLKKVDSNDGKGSDVVARNVTGKYVYDNRKAFEFEVRL
jgi:AAA15 family ATPase/GTPase